MSQSEINLVYIDDFRDTRLSRFMVTKYCSVPYKKSETIEIKKIYDELNFNERDGYESLIQNPLVKKANIILIDNHLFQESNTCNGRFSGKQFKIILRKIMPYIEVLIITQDKSLIGDKIIRKYSDQVPDCMLYYQNTLAPCLDQAIKEVLEFEELAEDLKSSSDVDKALIDNIMNLIDGNNSYADLKKEDIDKLIKSFKELKDAINKR